MIRFLGPTHILLVLLARTYRHRRLSNDSDCFIAYIFWSYPPRSNYEFNCYEAVFLLFFPRLFVFFSRFFLLLLLFCRYWSCMPLVVVQNRKEPKNNYYRQILSFFLVSGSRSMNVYISFASFLLFSSISFSITNAMIVASDVCVCACFLKKEEEESTSTLSPPRRPFPIQRHRPSSFG